MGGLPGMGFPPLFGNGGGGGATTFIGGSDYTYSSAGSEDPAYNVATNVPNGDRLAGDTIFAIRSSGATGDSGGPGYGTWNYYGELVYNDSQRVKLWHKRLIEDGESASWLGVAGTFVTFRGIDPTTPIADVAVEYLSTSNTTVNFPGVTAARPNSPVIMAIGLYNNNPLVSNYANGDLSDLVERQDGSMNIPFTRQIMKFATGIADAGAISADGTALLATGTANKLGVMIVLNPA